MKPETHAKIEFSPRKSYFHRARLRWLHFRQHGDQTPRMLHSRDDLAMESPGRQPPCARVPRVRQSVFEVARHQPLSRARPDARDARSPSRRNGARLRSAVYYRAEKLDRHRKTARQCHTKKGGGRNKRSASDTNTRLVGDCQRPHRRDGLRRAAVSAGGENRSLARKPNAT